MPSIVLADDHHIVRQGLRALLEAEPDFQVVGEASDGQEAIRLVERLKPDILVLDLMMGSVNGLEVARKVKKRTPQTNVIMLSMYGSEGYVLEALRAGAKAYILKDSTANELVHAVRETIAGRHYLGQPLSERAIEAYAYRSQSTVLDPYERLTTREREVLHLAAQGLTSADIAQQLYISKRTIELHRSNMMKKLGLKTQTQLIHYAIQRGLLPGDS